MINLPKSRIIARSSKKTGLPPGSLVYTGDKTSEPIRITLMDYDGQNLEERKIENVSQCRDYKSKPSVTWLNVDGIHNAGLVAEIGSIFDLHPLLLEDVLNPVQRPRRQIYENCIYIVLRMVFPFNGGRVESEQVSIVVGNNFILSFQEEGNRDVFDGVREHIRKLGSKLRSRGADYLAYSLVDTIVDGYFLVLEGLGEKLIGLERRVLKHASLNAVNETHNLKRELLFLRRSIWPLRELISGLERADTSIISSDTSIYFRDVYDHAVEVIEILEMYRDMLSGLQELYLSSVNNRTNNVMKLLAMVATVFMPLTFIAGIYGMNFKHMPELEWQYGYGLALLVMLVVGLGMLWWFKKNRWLA